MKKRFLRDIRYFKGADANKESLQKESIRTPSDKTLTTNRQKKSSK
jgi:hypothetical protein